MADPEARTSALPIGVSTRASAGSPCSAPCARLPNEALLYLGDTAPALRNEEREHGRATRSRRRAISWSGASSCLSWPGNLRLGPDDELTAAFADIPVLGVVEPGAEAAVRASRSGRIVVPPRKHRAKRRVRRAIRQRRPDADVVSKGCSVFVSLAEEGWAHGPVAELVAHEYLDDVLRSHRPDCLVLGCTHFPVLADTIRHVAGEGVALVDSAATTAVAVRTELARRGITTASETEGTMHLFATDSPERFHRVAQRFLPNGLLPQGVELVDLSR